MANKIVRMADQPHNAKRLAAMQKAAANAVVQNMTANEVLGTLDEGTRDAVDKTIKETVEKATAKAVVMLNDESKAAIEEVKLNIDSEIAPVKKTKKTRRTQAQMRADKKKEADDKT